MAFSNICFHYSGSGAALSLILNVEQYEYMRGPQNDAGIKVRAHLYWQQSQGQIYLVTKLLMFS